MLEAIVIGLANGGIYGLIALGIVLVYKGTRVLNFAQGEMGNLGLFIAWVVVEKGNMPWIVGALVALLAIAALGFLFERVVVRHMADAPKLTVTVATIGFLLLILGVELKVWGDSPAILDAPIAGLGPRIAGFYVSPMHMVSLAAVAIIGVGLAAFLRRTDFGLGVLAASQDPVATRLVGVPLTRVSSFTWVAAGALSALAALLIEPNIGLFHAGLMTTLFVRGLAAALLGGLTSLTGAFIGGVGIGVIEATVQHQFVQSTFPGAHVVALMLVIIGVLLLRPQGILGKVRA